MAFVDLAHELIFTELEYSISVEETALVANTALTPVPKRVMAELEAYQSYRMEPFSRHRTGSQVVTTTVESDKSNALRFLGYLKEHHEQVPSIQLFAHASIGQWTQEWMAWLKSELGLKASTLAVYCNGIISVSGYALTLVHDPSCPTEELLNLRRQAESIAKQVSSSHQYTVSTYITPSQLCPLS